jgi:hypothetical protein
VVSHGSSFSQTLISYLLTSTRRDWQKLIFYYYADHYVNFKDLVNDLYKLYKVRLWMSAVNPASFSTNAINQPPTGIGPGAIVTHSQSGPDFDNSYTMAYGTDPDPYGAIPPYQVPYNTYNPNYPSIPGINNSFAPAQAMGGMPQQDFGLDGMMQHFGMMQPYGMQQGMVQSTGTQQRKMQPIGAGRGGMQQQQGGVQQGGAVRGNGYQQGGLAQQDFAKISANNNSVDWEALGMFRR